jgi:hypothetical protein
MKLVFRAFTNCPTVVLLSEPKYQQIAPNVFSRGSWFRFQAWRHLKPASFTILRTC